MLKKKRLVIPLSTYVDTIKKCRPTAPKGASTCSSNRARAGLVKVVDPCTLVCLFHMIPQTQHLLLSSRKNLIYRENPSVISPSKVLCGDTFQGLC